MAPRVHSNINDIVSISAAIKTYLYFTIGRSCNDWNHLLQPCQIHQYSEDDSDHRKISQLWSIITEELIRKRSEHNEREIGTLEEISLHQENIERIEHLQHWCRDLKILLLHSNLISKIENLKKLKKLEYLNLTLNNVERIENLEGCESLQKLDLTLNFIGELTSVENLKDNIFLEDLYLTGNPCTDFKGYREYVITTLPQVKRLDNQEVLRSERIQALQIYDSIKESILHEQEEYKRKREKQKANIANKNNTNEGSNGTDDPENDQSFWSQVTENTPEARIEIANKVQKSKELKENKEERKPKRIIKLFNKDGKPLNINEPKIEFLFTEDDETNCFVLELFVYKYLDTTLLDIDVQPTYVKVLIKNKVFQMTLSEEVKIEESAAKRSQTSGHLVITMPKVNGNIKPKKKIIQPSIISENKSQKENRNNKRELLEIGSTKREMDYTKICENNKKSEKPDNKILRRKDIKEKVPSKDFIDDPEVPQLE